MCLWDWPTRRPLRSARRRRRSRATEPPPRTGHRPGRSDRIARPSRRNYLPAMRTALTPSSLCKLRGERPGLGFAGELADAYLVARLAAGLAAVDLTDKASTLPTQSDRNM